MKLARKIADYIQSQTHIVIFKSDDYLLKKTNQKLNLWCLGRLDSFLRK